jgi:dCTP deaminase
MDCQSGNPWEHWIPGVLHKSQIQQLNKCGFIQSNRTGGIDIGLCSIDLSLSNEVFRMTAGSMKPSHKYRYRTILENKGLAERLSPSGSDGSFQMRRGSTYVIKLLEKLDPLIGPVEIHGQATAKSSVGRIDVLARLIVDGMDKYECFDPSLLADTTGEMYIEVTPITFNVRVMPDKSISQLRLFYGPPHEAEISGINLSKTILGPEAEDNSLSVDLTGESIKGELVVAYRTCVPVSDDFIPLWKVEPKPDPHKYWETVGPNTDRRMQIGESKFYILKSMEQLRVPQGVAIYCKANDETLGEMRIHYAGFVHPFFGMDRIDKKRGTPLIFELRGHQLDVNLVHGEKLAILSFYRMSQDCTEDDKREEKRNATYNEQSLELSRLFDAW